MDRKRPRIAANAKSTPIDIKDISPPPSPTMVRVDSVKEQLVPYVPTPISTNESSVPSDRDPLFSDDDSIDDDGMRAASPPAIPLSIDDRMDEDASSGLPILPWVNNIQPSTGFSFFTHHYGESPHGTPPELPIATSDDETPAPDDTTSQRHSGTAAWYNESEGEALNGNCGHKHWNNAVLTFESIRQCNQVLQTAELRGYSRYPSFGGSTQ